MQPRFFPNDYFFIWLALVLMGLYCRPLMPVDETRAMSVAWDMWQRGDFLVPHLNGQPYSHKPPLLQWCIHGFWLLFGVNEWSARLVAPLFALGNLVMTVSLSKRLWPDDETSPKMAPLLLLCLPVWALWNSLTLYDMVATFFTLFALHGIIRAVQGETRLGWMMFGLAMGLGILAKGPAILIMTLPVALFAPWWIKEPLNKLIPPVALQAHHGRNQSFTGHPELVEGLYQRSLINKPKTTWLTWYACLLGAILVAALLALAWAVPAGFSGGEDYRNQIFWYQTAGRISHSFAHQRPFWWYFAVLPVVCLPWILWVPLWHSMKGLAFDSGLRFCAVQCLSGLALFSMASGKQVHYLMPLFPSLALMAAHALSVANPRILRVHQAPFGVMLVLLGFLLLYLPAFGRVLSVHEAAEIGQETPISVELLVLCIGIIVLAFRPMKPLTGMRIMTWAMLGLMLSVHLIFYQVGWQYYSMNTLAGKLADLEKQGVGIAYWNKYNGDFNFLGRLHEPLIEIGDKQKLLTWLNTHSQAYVVLVHRPDALVSEDGVAFAQFYRGSRRIMLWKSSELTNRPKTLQQLLE